MGVGKLERLMDLVLGNNIKIYVLCAGRPWMSRLQFLTNEKEDQEELIPTDVEVM